MNKYLILILLFMCAGCTTAGSSVAVDRLAIKVSQLESRLNLRDQEMDELKNDVRVLNSQVESMDLGAWRTMVDSEVLFKEIPETKETPKKVLFLGKKDDQVIRVSVSAQQVQTALQNAGYYKGKVDGKIGRKTREAIGQFQKDHFFQVDRVVGRQTWDELKNYLE